MKEVKLPLYYNGNISIYSVSLTCFVLKASLFVPTDQRTLLVTYLSMSKLKSKYFCKKSLYVFINVFSYYIYIQSFLIHHNPRFCDQPFNY